MRTVLFILVGLAVVAAAMWVAGPARRLAVAGGFAAVWLVVVAWNLRTGLSHGYSLREELPIQLLIYALPVIAAFWLWFRSRPH